jgi:hypothetical protein
MNTEINGDIQRRIINNKSSDLSDNNNLKRNYSINNYNNQSNKIIIDIKKNYSLLNNSINNNKSNTEMLNRVNSTRNINNSVSINRIDKNRNKEYIGNNFNNMQNQRQNIHRIYLKENDSKIKKYNFSCQKIDNKYNNKENNNRSENDKNIEYKNDKMTNNYNYKRDSSTIITKVRNNGQSRMIRRNEQNKNPTHQNITTLKSSKSSYEIYKKYITKK